MSEGRRGGGKWCKVMSWLWRRGASASVFVCVLLYRLYLWKHTSFASSILVSNRVCCCLCAVAICFIGGPLWVCLWHCIRKKKTKKTHIALMSINPDQEACWGAQNLGESLPDVLQLDGAVSTVPQVRCQQGARDAQRQRPITAASQVRRRSTYGQQWVTHQACIAVQHSGVILQVTWPLCTPLGDED